MPCASHVLHLVFAGKGQGSWTFHDGSRYYQIHLRYQPPLPTFFFLAYLYLIPSPPHPSPPFSQSCMEIPSTDSVKQIANDSTPIHMACHSISAHTLSLSLEVLHLDFCLQKQRLFFQRPVPKRVPVRCLHPQFLHRIQIR